MSQRNENDAYYTPPALTRVLLDRLKPHNWSTTVEPEDEDEPKRKRLIAEPCAGDTKMAYRHYATQRIEVQR